jgi:[ribosomal protein S5]-alanine N-acetyltransferase
LQEIITPRLSLRLMTEEFLEACLMEDAKKAESLLGLKIPADWFDEKDITEIRLDDYRADAGYIPWGLRGIGLRESSEMVGYINFHTCPNPEYLQDIAPHSVEIGYTIFLTQRRRGFAQEALLGMMNWAIGQYPLESFIASVAPTNLPSTAMVKKLRFEKVGEFDDAVDGLEFVYALAAEKLKSTEALIKF